MFKESCKIYERYINTPDVITNKLYYYPQYAGRFVCNPDFFIEREGFKSLLVLYTVRGSAKLIYHNKEYILTPRNFALIDCRDKHVYYPTKNNEWHFNFIHFAGQNCFKMYEHLYSLNNSPVFESNDELYGNILSCIQGCAQKHPYNDALISKLLNDLLHYCVLQTHSKSANMFSPVCEYIKQNYNTISDTATLAKHFGFSRSYFSVLFKKHTGVSVHEYILCYRLSAAKILLLENNLSINEIAQKSGFDDTGTFIRAFKRKENCTPTNFREQFLSNKG